MDGKKKKEKKAEDRLRRLLAVRRRSSSEAEFRLRLAAAGENVPLRDRILLRACLLRKRHRRGFELAELALLGGGVVGFSLWGGLTGQKSPGAGAGILALALAVLAPAAWALSRFDWLFAEAFSQEEKEEEGL